MRHSNTILGQRGYGQYAEAPMVNLQHGGQMGPMPDYGNYVSSSAYVRHQVVPVLLAAPLGFKDFDQPQLYRDTLKSLIELHSLRIEGLNKTLRAEFSETPFGGAGEMQQDITNMRRERSTPTHTWTERYGRPISSFFEQWMTGLMMDPNTKYPAVIQRGGPYTGDLLPDYTGATVLYYEPDPTHRKVLNAWLSTNMMPDTNGPVEARRDMTADGDTVEVTVAFTSITQVGFGVNRLAQTLLNRMNLAGMNPNLHKAFMDDITEDVKASGKGYKEALDDGAANGIG